jgi:hypothetical protein
MYVKVSMKYVDRHSDTGQMSSRAQENIPSIIQVMLLK